MQVKWKIWLTGFEEIEFYYLICEKIEYELAERSLVLKIVEHGCVAIEEGQAVKDTSKIESALKQGIAVPIIEREDSRHWEIRFKNASSFRVEDESFFSNQDMLAEKSDDYLHDGVCSCYIIQESKWFESFWIKPNDEFFPMKIYGIRTAHDILHIMVPNDEEPTVLQIK